ncbi:SCO1431 family membrane protein [Streptomyces sp. VRA16 Mangrove soil]|uniref:SCO1431 family membrane protein n=1 Tax=Streptomyces sp. VRA16 Mangrove soil TaxID=2817434 RepID=UPI001A9E61AC|nr:SCO1431 family membrane protein [Streptomyces sp. VRA16 Mangrove soil]MBO1331520.1 SCO1431 family membrane protein [Streptomyces sp. VRA16 Mangrove soil]
MTASSTTSAPASASVSAALASLVTRARTGGPKDDGPKVLEHVLGWTFVVVLAMFVTQLGWM